MRKTIEQKILERKYKVPPKFITWLYRTINKRVVINKWNYHNTVIDHPKDCKGPCFIVYDHQSRVDHGLITEICYPRPVNFLANYGEFHKAHFKIVFKLNNVIPKKMFTVDVPSLKAMASVIKQGGCIALSPEGTSTITGRSQPVASGTGKLLKHHKIPVYMIYIEGGYLANHKCSLDFRYGRVDLTMKLLFTPEDLERMSPEEIEDKMNEVLYFDNYEWNAKEKVKFATHQNTCKNLEDICYKCPTCGSEFTLKGIKDKITCSACGCGVQIDDYYESHPLTPNTNMEVCKSPSIWSEWCRDRVKEEIKDPNFSFSVDALVGTFPDYKYLKKGKLSEICGKGTIKMDHEGFHFYGNIKGEDKELFLSYGDCPSLPISDTTQSFGVFIDNVYYVFYPVIPAVIKCLHIQEEMHRLHFNRWKDYKWRREN